MSHRLVSHPPAEPKETLRLSPSNFVSRARLASFGLAALQLLDDILRFLASRHVIDFLPVPWRLCEPSPTPHLLHPSSSLRCPSRPRSPFGPPCPLRVIVEFCSFGPQLPLPLLCFGSCLPSLVDLPPRPLPSPLPRSQVRHSSSRL